MEGEPLRKKSSITQRPIGLHCMDFISLYEDFNFLTFGISQGINNITKPAIVRQPAEIRQPHPFAGSADCDVFTFCLIHFARTTLSVDLW